MTNEQQTISQLIKALKVCQRALKDHVQYDDGESLERDGYNAATQAINDATRY